MSALTRHKEAGGSAFSAFSPVGASGVRMPVASCQLMASSKYKRSHAARRLAQASLLGSSAPASGQAPLWTSPVMPAPPAGRGALSTAMGGPSAAAGWTHLSPPYATGMLFPHTPVSSSAPSGDGFAARGGSLPPSRSKAAGKKAAGSQLQVQVRASL